MMDFAFSDEQEQLRAETIEFARTQLDTDLVARDAALSFDRELWQRCADFGTQGYPAIYYHKFQ